jgi:hypothetical protein
MNQRVLAAAWASAIGQASRELRAVWRFVFGYSSKTSEYSSRKTHRGVMTKICDNSKRGDVEAWKS